MEVSYKRNGAEIVYWPMMDFKIPTVLRNPDAYSHIEYQDIINKKLQALEDKMPRAGHCQSCAWGALSKERVDSEPLTPLLVCEDAGKIVMHMHRWAALYGGTVDDSFLLYIKAVNNRSYGAAVIPDTEKYMELWRAMHPEANMIAPIFKPALFFFGAGPGMELIFKNLPKTIAIGAIEPANFDEKAIGEGGLIKGSEVIHVGTLQIDTKRRPNVDRMIEHSAQYGDAKKGWADAKFLKESGFLDESSEATGMLRYGPDGEPEVETDTDDKQ